VKDILQTNQNLINYIAYKVVELIPEVPIKVNNDDFVFTTRATASNAVLFPEIVTKDYTTSLANNFNKPVLFLWGKYDFAVSKKLRDSLIPKLTANKITNISFDASGHYMMFHEPTKFSTSITDFIKTL
jgi:pimeloyl-ACP methyl ester carboxylesterase